MKKLVQTLSLVIMNGRDLMRMTKRRGNQVVLILMFAVYALLSAGGLILFKMGGQDTAIQSSSSGLSLLLSWKMLAGILCYMLSFVLWLLIVSKTQLSFAMPLSVGVVNILVFLGSARYLHEEITPLKMIGLGVIIVGLFLITTGGRK